jgi:hypothetical protein
VSRAWKLNSMGEEVLGGGSRYGMSVFQDLVEPSNGSTSIVKAYPCEHSFLGVPNQNLVCEEGIPTVKAHGD